MQKLSLYLLIISTLGFSNSCTTTLQAEVSKDVAGVYSLIADPARCALPTTNEVTITSQNGVYVASFVNLFTRKSETSPMLTVERTGDVSVIKVGSKEVGKYAPDTYVENGKKVDGMLLMININLPNTPHFEFMGKK